MAGNPCATLRAFFVTKGLEAKPRELYLGSESRLDGGVGGAMR